MPFFKAIYHLLVDFNTYFLLAIVLLNLQLFWKFWKGRLSPKRIVVKEFSLSRMLLTSAALLLILVLVIPTLYAFGFTSWLFRWPNDLWIGFN